MIEKTTKPKIAILDVIPQCAFIIRLLAECYAPIRPECAAEDCIWEIVDLIAKYDDPYVLNPHEIVKQFLRPELDENVLARLAQRSVGPILVSIAYCERAKRNYRLDFTTVAWSDTASAMYWCGVARTVNGVETFMDQAWMEGHTEGAAHAISKKGKSGAAGRDRKYKPLRELAHQYALLPDKKWPSQTRAAQLIALELQKYCEGQATASGEKMRAPTPRTVFLWLNEIPNAVSLFPKKKRTV